MIVFVVIGIAIVSIGLSLWSLRNLLKMQEVEKARDDLSKSKILFQSDSSQSSDTETSKE